MLLNRLLESLRYDLLSEIEQLQYPGTTRTPKPSLWTQLQEFYGRVIGRLESTSKQALELLSDLLYTLMIFIGLFLLLLVVSFGIVFLIAHCFPNFYHSLRAWAFPNLV